jgi:hypothetical protein
MAEDHPAKRENVAIFFHDHFSPSTTPTNMTKNKCKPSLCDSCRYRKMDDDRICDLTGGSIYAPDHKLCYRDETGSKALLS